MRQLTVRLLTKMVRNALRTGPVNRRATPQKAKPRFLPRFDTLEERALPGDTAGGLFIAGMMLGASATTDPVARAEGVLDLTPVQVNYADARSQRVVYDNPLQDLHTKDGLDVASAAME